MRNILPKDVLLTLYYSLIYPYLTYCCIICGGASNSALHHISVLQNRAIRLITRSPFRTPTTPLFAQLKLLQVMDIRKLQILLFMFKCKVKQLPAICLNYCPLNCYHSYDMRSTSHFVCFHFAPVFVNKVLASLGQGAGIFFQ